VFLVSFGTPIQISQEKLKKKPNFGHPWVWYIFRQEMKLQFFLMFLGAPPPIWGRAKPISKNDDNQK